jgi:hypothetical protein
MTIMAYRFPEGLHRKLTKLYSLGIDRLLEQGEFAVSPTSSACYYNTKNSEGKLIHCIFALMFTEEQRTELPEDGTVQQIIRNNPKLPDYLGITKEEKELAQSTIRTNDIVDFFCIVQRYLHDELADRKVEDRAEVFLKGMELIEDEWGIKYESGHSNEESREKTEDQN